MIDLDTARRRFETFLDAMEKYAGANSDEARAEAEEKALAARAALDRETGILRLRQRRMAAQALGHSAPGTAPREADDFDRLISDCLDTIETPSGRQRLRHALAIYFLDDEAVLTARFARLLTAKMLANAKGLLGALDHVESTSGVDSSTGLADNLRNKIILNAGYTAGLELGPRGRIPHALWERAARDHADLAQGGRAIGRKIRDADAGTIKSWCQKKNLSADLFNEARLAGVAARARPDTSRMLTAAE
jgi:hypothetical protein